MKTQNSRLLLSELRIIREYLEALIASERVIFDSEEEVALCDRILMNAAVAILQAEGSET